MTRLYVQHRSRVVLLNTCISGLLVAVVVKLFYIQILRHDDYQIKAERQSTDMQVLQAVRGNIEDRHGDGLTSNIIHYSFAVDAQVLKDVDSLVSLLARTFNRSPAYYRKRIASDRSFIWLERNVSHQVASSILGHKNPGLIIRPEVRRRYPYGHIIAPLVGFTDIDGKGISGLELEYDTFLRGENGWQVLKRNAKGRVFPAAESRLPRDGARIRLTIDIDYQSVFQEEMARAFQRLAPKAIHGILMNPHSGEILALAQYPSFDPDDPQASPPSNQRIRAITDMFEPGSSLKVVSVTAALDRGVYTPEDEFNCEQGEFTYHNLTIRDVYPKGILTLTGILAHSSNIGIIKIAESLGKNQLYKYCSRFGLGARTGINLPGESPGLLRDTGEWSAVSTGEIAMGQEVGVTTLQLALVYSAIANGGLLMRPFIVSRIMDSDGSELVDHHPEVIRRVASPASMEQLRKILLAAVEQGTGSAAYLPGYMLAGKTGTAQKFLEGKYSDTEFVATFVGIFPADRPRLVCAVAVDSPRYGSHFGGEAAAPIVRNTLKRMLNLDDNFYVPPQPARTQPKSDEASPYLLVSAGRLVAATDPGVIPDFKGYSLRKALQLARRTGVRLQVEGSGQVVKQSIKSGTLVNPEEVCTIFLRPEGSNR